MLTPSSERKIDQIETRLGSIEGLLKNLSTGSTMTSGDHTRPIQTPTTGSSAPTCDSNGDADTSEDDAAFGGDSGLTAHTAFASEFLEQAVQRTSLRSPNPKMDAALQNLGQLVEMQKRGSNAHRPRFTLQRNIPPGGVTKLPLPPMATVVELLKQNKCKCAAMRVKYWRVCADQFAAVPLTLFTIMCALVGVTDFSNMCRAVYFPTEDVSEATFAVVNALLYTLFMEQHAVATDEARREEYYAHFELCRENLETTLAVMPMLLSARIDNVQALLLGVSHHFEEYQIANTD